MLKRILMALLLAGLTPALPAHADGGSNAAGDATELVTISHFSGKPVPRFESLRASTVYGRAGPARAYPILWQYERKGLPMLVLKETIDWRRVRDPDGDEVWIHKSLLAGGTTVLLRGNAWMRRSPAGDGDAVAEVEVGVIGALLECDSGWCRIGVDRRQGWVPQAVLWGASEPGDAL